MNKNGMVFKTFLILFAFFGFTAFAWGHTDVSTEQAKAMIDTNNQLILIDVRTLGEYCGIGGHIPGALNYPWPDVFQSVYTELPPDADILLVCGVGGRSNQAADFLDSHGYLHVYDMTGGMSAWTYGTVGCIDTDSDGINDDLDNCPAIPNAGQEDADSDETGNLCDNCPIDYNSLQIDCDSDGTGDICDPDTTDPDGDGVDFACDNCTNTPNALQEDSFPPQGNNCGNACECEGNFDIDDNVDGSDASTFKRSYGRNSGNRPCTNGDLCNGDFTCDGDVDGTDASKFKSDFGRNVGNNPCPSCHTVPWCVY